MLGWVYLEVSPAVENTVMVFKVELCSACDTGVDFLLKVDAGNSYA